MSNVDLAALDSMDPTLPAEELLAIYGDVLPGLLAMMGYALGLLAMSVAGLVLLVYNCRKLTWLPAERQLPRGTAVKTVYVNWGMGVYILLCLISCVIALF